MTASARRSLVYGAMVAFLSATICVVGITRASAQQSAQPQTATLPILPVLGGARVLYVIAVGADYSARSKVIATLAERLEKYRLRGNPWIFAEPDWSVENYIQQCAAHPQTTEGAILLSVAATATGSANKFFYSKNWFELDSDSAFVTCDAVAGGKPTYGISWASGVQLGYASRDTYAQLFGAVAMLFAAVSTASTFIPSHTTTTASTIAFPRSTPVPPGGEQVEQTNTTSETSNPSALANSSATLLAPALALAPPQAQTPVVDGMTWNAAEALVETLLERMNCQLLEAGAAGRNVAYTPAPFCAP